MPGKKYRITLTEAEKELLQKIIGEGACSKPKRKRAVILLAGARGTPTRG
jgi:hypothetical protein